MTPFRPKFDWLFLLCQIVLTLALPAAAFATCAIGPSTFAEGTKYTFYAVPSVPAGGICADQAAVRSCRGGQLSQSDAYRYGSCTVLEGFTGVNTNNSPELLDPQLLQKSGTKWVRSIAEVLKYREQFETGKIRRKLRFSDWSVFSDAAASGQKSILTLKWDFAGEGQHPPLPGSQEEKELFAFLDLQILDALAPSASIIVTGNEPFVNTSRGDWAQNGAYGGIPIVVFYQRVTEHVNDYLVAKGLRGRTQVYVGAFTALYTPAMQRQPAVQQLLNFADTAPFVDGIDVHTHVSALDQIDSALRYVRDATAKPVIITEYTYVWGMKQALEANDKLGAEFADHWGYPRGTPTINYLRCEVFRRSDACADNPPISKAEWDDFLATRSWYIDHFLLQANQIFRRYNVRGATYGLVQSEPSVNDLMPNGTPWYLGFLFSPAALGRDASGVALPNYQSLDDFRQLQR